MRSIINFHFILLSLCFSALASASYIDNGDGTVTDSTTGLTWMRCAAGQIWTGSTCSGTAGTYTFATATYPWRLPSIRELQTIIDWSASNSAIDSAVFPNTPSSSFKSDSLVAGSSTSGWNVYFYTGSTSYIFLSYGMHARFVSGGQSFASLLNLARPTTDYVDNNDGTTIHIPTRLMWKRCAEGQTWSATTCVGTASSMTVDQATTASNSYAGMSDWRLPTEKELLSLVDYETKNPAINATIFPATPSSCFWSGSPSAYSSSDAWGVVFGYGLAETYVRSQNCGVRLVRDVPPTSLLTTGWNLVGNSTDTSLDVAFSFVDANNVGTVWKWNQTTGRWAFYSPSLAGPALTDYAASKGYDVLASINSGEGFWVNAKAPFTFALPIGKLLVAASFQTTLKPGWNLVSVGENNTPKQFNDALSQVQSASGVATLWAWDKTQSKWYFYAPDMEAQGGTALADYITSKGYLNFTENNKTLGPGMGFWVNKP